MGDFFVEAISAPVLIEDMKRWVTPSSPCWMSAEECRGSICLSSLVRMGKLRVTSKKRSVEERVSKPPKSPPPPFMRKMQVKRKAPAPQHITMEEAQQLAAKAAEEAAKKALAAVADRLVAPAPVAAPLSAEQLEQALAKALAGVQFNAREYSRPQTQGPEDPLFIPSGIVKESSEDLDVKSTSSKDSDLGSAASALKALKKGREKKGKE